MSNKISSEHLVFRFGRGIKLIHADNTHLRKYNFNGHPTGHTLESILKFDFAVFFENTDHITCYCNEVTANAYNFDSVSHCIGKSWVTNFTKLNLKKVLTSDQNIVRQNSRVIENNSYIRKNGTSCETLSIRMPWYNEDNKVIGLFGCSILLGVQPLANSLSEVSRLGLLNCVPDSIISGIEINNQYLSKRELECLHLAIRGKSARQAAIELGISQRTVEEYLNNIKLKMRVKSKSEMIDAGVNLLFDYGN
jgi:DNA-binding CsgD family transcriptional regulator